LFEKEVDLPVNKQLFDLPWTHEDYPKECEREIMKINRRELKRFFKAFKNINGNG
jgi:hypothetical protein